MGTQRLPQPALTPTPNTNLDPSQTLKPRNRFSCVTRRQEIAVRLAVHGAQIPVERLSELSIYGAVVVELSVDVPADDDCSYL